VAADDPRDRASAIARRTGGGRCPAYYRLDCRLAEAAQLISARCGRRLVARRRSAASGPSELRQLCSGEKERG